MDDEACIALLLGALIHMQTRTLLAQLQSSRQGCTSASAEGAASVTGELNILQSCNMRHAQRSGKGHVMPAWGT